MLTGGRLADFIEGGAAGDTAGLGNVAEELQVVEVHWG